jgi:hypothetical protein
MPRAGLLITCGLLGVLAGCGDGGREAFVKRVRSAATHHESRSNPLPLARSQLVSVCGTPDFEVEVDARTHSWVYEFPDGSVEIPVLVQPGHDWSQDDPEVFVDLPRISLKDKTSTIR